VKWFEAYALHRASFCIKKPVSAGETSSLAFFSANTETKPRDVISEDIPGTLANGYLITHNEQPSLQTVQFSDSGTSMRVRS